MSGAEVDVGQRRAVDRVSRSIADPVAGDGLRLERCRVSTRSDRGRLAMLGQFAPRRRVSTNCALESRDVHRLWVALIPGSGRRALPGHGRTRRRVPMGVAGADALLSLIKQKQDLQGYRERHWTGTLADYMEIVMANPRVARNAYQRLYDMILSHGVTRVHAPARALRPLPALRRPHRQRPRRRVRPRRAAHAARAQRQVRRLRLRHGEAHPAAARPGGLVQVHHRAPPQEGRSSCTRTSRRARSTPSAGRPDLGATGHETCSGARCTRTRCT